VRSSPDKNAVWHFENYQDMKAGDIIECYRVETVQRTPVSSRLTFASLAIIAGLSPAILEAKTISET